MTTDSMGLETDATGTPGQSVVGECSVTTCRYNQSEQCVAGTIKVAFVDGMAHCATFAPGPDGKAEVDAPDTSGLSVDMGGANAI